jgi:hypothetical protein
MEMETDIRALQTLPEDEPDIGLWPCAPGTGSDGNDEE